MTYSPLLGIVTAAFEVLAAGWTVRGPGRRPVLRATAAILLALAAYQVVEVAICSLPPTVSFLPRLAFMIVTWLPPLGVLLVSRLLGPGARAARLTARGLFALSLGFHLWIAFDKGFATLSVCEAVYARYDHPAPAFLAYSVYYWLGLLGLVAFSAPGAARGRGGHDARLVRLVHVGALGFIVPSVIASRLVPEARGALPSILCHFAVLLAVALVRLVHQERVQAERTAPETITPAFS